MHFSSFHIIEGLVVEENTIMDSGFLSLLKKKKTVVIRTKLFTIAAPFRAWKANSLK